MSGSSKISVRIPVVLHESLAATAAAERRSLSSIIVSLLDRGVVERAKEQEIVRRRTQHDRAAA